MTRQHIIFITGAGTSAESGLSTFRGKDGLWTKVMKEIPIESGLYYISDYAYNNFWQL